MRDPAKPCPVTIAARITSGKWKPRLLHALMQNRAMRFSELRRSCPPISDRILSKELRELELWQVIERRELTDRPLTTEYHLSEHGDTFRAVMSAMLSWSQAYESQRSGSRDRKLFR